jgi:hypothetical protein
MAMMVIHGMKKICIIIKVVLGRLIADFVLVVSVNLIRITVKAVIKVTGDTNDNLYRRY